MAVNRSLYDDLPTAATFSLDVAAAAERRLGEIEVLAARLRRERLIPQSPLATHARESESVLNAGLDRAIRQLDLLQSRRLGLPVTG